MKITARRVKLLLTLWASKGRCVGIINCIGSKWTWVFADYDLPRLAYIAPDLAAGNGHRMVTDFLKLANMIPDS